MAWLPCVSVVVEKVALPLLITPLPICVAPSRKLTVPLIEPEVCEVIVAVNVTDCPTVDGFCEEARAVLVAAKEPAFTVCKMPEEVLGAKLASPG